MMKSKNNNSCVEENESLIGIAWYNKCEWDTLLHCSEERGDFPDTYQEWEKESEERYQKLLLLGVNIHKIHIGISELMNWCEETSMPVNEHARNLFLAIKIHRIFITSTAQNAQSGSVFL